MIFVFWDDFSILWRVNTQMVHPQQTSGVKKFLHSQLGIGCMRISHGNLRFSRPGQPGQREDGDHGGPSAAR